MGMLARSLQVSAVKMKEEVLLLRLRPTPSTADALNDTGLLRAVQWCSPRGMTIVKRGRASEELGSQCKLQEKSRTEMGMEWCPARPQLAGAFT